MESNDKKLIKIAKKYLKKEYKNIKLGKGYTVPFVAGICKVCFPFELENIKGVYSIQSKGLLAWYEDSKHK
jgi:hypothetical protein